MITKTSWKLVLGLFIPFLFASCKNGCFNSPNICFKTSGYRADYLIPDEIEYDFSHLSNEELKESICETYQQYVSEFSRWEHREREAQRLWVHDQVSYRLQKQAAVEAANEACILEVRLEQLKKEADLRKEIEV